MKTGNLTAYMTSLREALETLEESWAETQFSWNDAASRNLEQNHLQPLVPKVRGAFDASQRLTEVLAKAYRDCE